jgi:hypothetical protein
MVDASTPASGMASGPVEMTFAEQLAITTTHTAIASAAPMRARTKKLPMAPRHDRRVASRQELAT